MRLALVSIPVEIFSATRSTAGIALNQTHKPSGKRIKLEKTVPGIGGVDADDIVKGYEVEKGEYVLLSEAELEDVKLESRKTFELVQFVDGTEIDPIYFRLPRQTHSDDEQGRARKPDLCRLAPQPTRRNRCDALCGSCPPRRRHAADLEGSCRYQRCKCVLGGRTTTENGYKHPVEFSTAHDTERSALSRRLSL